MQLQYLVFDFSDEESGRGSFDAMASVAPARIPALLHELSTVLRWATETFGPASALEEAHWDYELQAIAEPDRPLEIAYVQSSREVSLDAAAHRASRTTVTLTLSGSHAFCETLRDRFELHE